MSQQVAVNQKTLELLDSLVERTSCNRTEILEEAIVAYDEYDKWFRQEVELGIKNAEADPSVPDELVQQRIKTYLQKLRDGKSGIAS